MVSHADGGHEHVHAAPTGWIRKYIFSLDHKVIGIQYFLLALVLGISGYDAFGFHAHSPGVAEHSPAVYRRRRDDARTISGAADHAREHHGVHGADDRAAIRIRKLLSADPNWRGRHGVPRPEHAFVLDDICFAGGDGLRVFR